MPTTWTKTLLAATAALSLGWAGSVSAATIVQTVSLIEPVFNVVTDGSSSFNQFDASLGTLDSVSFQYDLSEGVVYFTTTSDYVDYVLFNPDFSTQLLHGSNRGIAGGVNFGPPPVINYTDPSLAQYTGTGALTLKANVSKQYNNSRVHINGSPSAVITYTYTAATLPPGPVGAIPEPSTWALMILGFGATGSALRRRARGAFVAV